MVSRRKVKRGKKGKVGPSLSPADTTAAGPAPAPAQPVGSAPARGGVLTYVGGPDQPDPVALVEAHELLLGVSLSRARLYGELLAQEFAREGVDALRGEIVVSGQHGSFKTGEYVRALLRLETQERERAERLITAAVRLGIEARRHELRRDQAHTLVLALRNLAAELGVADSPELRRTMQRAVIQARQTVVRDGADR